MRRESISKRLETIENRIRPTGHNVSVHLGPDGTVTECFAKGRVEGRVEGREPDPAMVATASVLCVISSPPWDPELLRLLTEDELEAEYPGRRARLEEARKKFPKVFALRPWNGGGSGMVD